MTEIPRPHLISYIATLTDPRRRIPRNKEFSELPLYDIIHLTSFRDYLPRQPVPEWIPYHRQRTPDLTESYNLALDRRLMQVI